MFRFHRSVRRILCPIFVLSCTAAAVAQNAAEPLIDPKFAMANNFLPARKPVIEPVQFTQETLENGLRVIYIPLKQTPVVHVRVLYHVGSRDEKENRQGFAHMFEHMMFRGSAHVPPQEHMKLIGIVGGMSNAFTSFDQTTYVNTVPANQLELPLYLEADRMASFKVSDEIYKVERNVVAKEWGIRQNKPYGTMFEDFLSTAFNKSSYRWTPIGNMDHLKAAAVSELQAFFNKYYIPNNAVLVISGDFDIDQAKAMVRKYYAWIPKGAEIDRGLAVEPAQTEAREKEVKRAVQLPAVMIGYKLPSYESDDYAALGILGAIMGDGDSSRLDRKLVNNEKPLCTNVSAGPFQLQDAGVFTVSGTVMQGKDPQAVKAALFEAIDAIVKNGVTDEEIAKAKLMSKKSIVAGRERCDQLAGQVGEEELFAGDAKRVNTTVAQMFAVTAADVQRVAAKYLQKESSSTLVTLPDPLGMAARGEAANEVKKLADAPVATTTDVVEPRAVAFPDGYPAKAPVATSAANPSFKKGEESVIDGVKVIVMEDHRLPLVTWNLTMRRGGYGAPNGKEGVSHLTAAMLHRGAADLNYQQLSEDLESHAISIDASDGGDFTRLTGSAITDELDHAMLRTQQILLQPTFPQEEFDKLQAQTLSQLAVQQDDPATVAGQEFANALYGHSPLGRTSTPESIAAITLDDVRAYYRQTYTWSDSPVLVLAGDVTVEHGRELAKKLLDAWVVAQPVPQEAEKVNYAPWSQQERANSRPVILIDNPVMKQSVIRIGLLSYDIHSDEKFAGMLTGQILSAGIDSRLGRYVRAEKGYVYGIGASFAPGRHSGTFGGGTETGFDTTGPTIDAMFKVFNDLRTAEVTANELAEAKTRVAGAMLMETQTIQQQAGRRVDAILNDYPIDYWDKLPAKVAEVTLAQVQAVMKKYVNDDKMAIIVVAPSEKVQPQLKKFGHVMVKPMPSKRNATTEPAGEMLK